MDNTELSILSIAADSLFVLCLAISLYFALERFQSTRDIISNSSDMSFKILFHHSICDVLITISRLILTLLTIFTCLFSTMSNIVVINDLNNTSYYFFIVYINASFIFVLNISLDVYLKLKFSAFFDQNFRKIIIFSYMIPVLAILSSYVMESIFKFDNYAFENIFLLIIPLIITISLIFFTVYVRRVAKSMNIVICLRKMIVIPVIQAAILLEIILWLVLLPTKPSFLYSKDDVSYDTYNIINLLIFSLYPTINYFLYMRLNREELSKRKTIELDSRLDMALHKEEHNKEIEMLENAHDL